MKKSKINLIVNREDYQRYENYFNYLKIGLAIFLGVFFVVFLFLFILVKKRLDIVEKLELTKKNYLEILKDKKTDEAKINYIEKKYQDLNSFLKEDAFSSPYYSLLNSALTESSEAAKLKSFEISKNREVDFIIEFTDFPKLMNFFKFIESETFLKNFETISLKSFTVIGATLEKEENYELSFSGIFIQLKRTL
ncbi:MAG: hypothetical protein US40_C0006G0011 [Candidatus Roizmanbacteria bacterium GW2011_GWC2_37_13]|uniref:Uncharacterized protein n=1 Tax=Candidatus Roizmanbacteria bacterium GW2011_GWC2_37_13 TaxID=1618486 RepID=A0A0G0INE4_9BACT|nr:MAG: hypothetical protein US38_C0010G0014 [Candidatus Roizmanbacteria bacterium GW2011_GWC1_37_12]KKQ25694.1 MAG: hypothetical protein US40_C0006G0011 [Candidatus Roizmanbacteria bacterium GW2011_GWC2_37_13]